ncbi:MAG: hypothetical protein KDD64_15815 [Bdellovibrionales bacterium]|nr:hypothetical protein [Bdellovibrionales bacterium]
MVLIFGLFRPDPYKDLSTNELAERMLRQYPELREGWEELQTTIGSAAGSPFLDKALRRWLKKALQKRDPKFIKDFDKMKESVQFAMDRLQIDS